MKTDYLAHQQTQSSSYRQSTYIDPSLLEILFIEGNQIKKSPEKAEFAKLTHCIFYNLPRY
jgi:hypothetical protein